MEKEVGRRGGEGGRDARVAGVGNERSVASQNHASNRVRLVVVRSVHLI